MNVRVTILHDAVSGAVPEAADLEETRLPDAPNAPNSRDAFDAELLSLDQPLMELLTDRKVEPGAALRIDTDDALWLGEAEECAAADGGFIVRVRLRHVLRDFETLARLAERFGAVSTKGIPVQI